MSMGRPFALGLVVLAACASDPAPRASAPVAAPTATATASEPPPHASNVVGTHDAGRVVGPRELEGKGTASLSTEDINRVIRGNMKVVRDCYNDGLKKNPKLEGKMLVKLSIRPDGSVATATDAGSPPFADKGVATCAMNAFKLMVFPESGSATLTVTYPIRFDAPE